jgi:hypothetical protein
VVPGWCLGKDDGWKKLVEMWVGEVKEFEAKSFVNKGNRGNKGIHVQGNRDHSRFKSHLVYIWN